MAEKLLELDDLAVHFTVGSALKGGVKTLKAVDGVSLDVKAGECLGLVGESGCGKSTLALAIMGLIPPTRGRIVLNGHELSGRERMATARTVQMVFQDPYASLNPRCPAVTDICRTNPPEVTPLPADGLVWCHHHG